jgi:hypothetical protein
MFPEALIKAKNFNHWSGVHNLQTNPTRETMMDPAKGIKGGKGAGSIKPRGAPKGGSAGPL